MTIPNILSILRMVLIPFFVMALIYGHPETALWIFISAGITDGLDGFIARVFDQKSDLGAFLDPMADKLLLTSALIALAIPEAGIPHGIPTWLPVLTITRDVVIVLIALSLNVTFSVKNFPPSGLGKVTTFFQITFVAAVLIQNAYIFPNRLVNILMVFVAFFTVLSGLHYLWRMRSLIEELL